jgi:hypothetical protein
MMESQILNPCSEANSQAPGPPTQVSYREPRAMESPGSPVSWNRTTYGALVTLVFIWAAKMYLTWEAWGNLTIDSGHEMYIPALLAEGKLLYRDVWFLYGPAAPYFNAFLYRIFGIHLNVLYWAGSLSALGSAILLYLTGMRLSSWVVGWAAGAVVLLEAFEPSFFCFPLPYSFAAVYGCLIGCAFLWMAISASATTGWGWMLGAGSAAAVALLLKPEFGIACYGTLMLLIALRGLSQRSWGSVARDLLSISPGVLSCVLVIWWMVSIGGFEFITQENILSWPTSYFMKTYGSMWLQENGFTLTLSAFHFALWRAIPIAGFLATLYGPLWKRAGARSLLLRAAMVIAVIAYLALNSYSSRAPWPARLDLTLATIFFPRDMVLYVALATPVALFVFWRRRAAAPGGYAAILVLLAYSSLLAFRILMRMLPAEYCIYYNGPVVLSFLWVACRFIPRATLSRRSALVGEALICLMCVSVAGLYASRVEANASNYVPLTTERGTVRAPESLVKNYEVAIQFMKEKAAIGQSVLSVPEDTSLYFLSGTYCPTRVILFIPGVVAPGRMTEATIREIDQKPVRYLLWSNRTFAEYGVPIFGRDFNQELGAYLKSHYQFVGPLTPPTSMWNWSATVWERKQERIGAP